MDVVFGLLFAIALAVGVIWFVCRIDVESKKDNLEATEEDLIYKKLINIFPNLNKDIFSKKLYNIKYDYKNYNCKWFLDKEMCDMNYTIALYQLNIFCLNCEFYKNVFNIFNQNYYFYNSNEIHLGIIEDFNDICKLDDMVGELPKSNSLSYKNFLIKSFLVKYGQKLVRNGNESYYVNTYTLKQEYCLSIENKRKYINEKENLSNE